MHSIAIRPAKKEGGIHMLHIFKASRPRAKNRPHLCALLFGSALALLAAIFSAQAQEGEDESSLPSIPDYFQQNGLSEHHGYDRQSAQETINTFSGKLHYRFVDILIPGNGGMDLAIQRSYNSIDDPFATPAKWNQYEYSPVGLGWTMHMGRVIRGASKAICSTSWAFAAANPVLELPDGSRHILYEQSGQSHTWMSRDFWRAQCHNAHLQIQSPDGTTYDMGAMGHMFGEPGNKQRAWYASRITDRNGNWFDLNYQILPNGITALKSITTSDGRKVNFSYGGSTLSSITDVQTGRVWEYTIGAGPGTKNYLQKVKRPDGLAWQYTYRQSSPGTGSLRSVQYPEGGHVEYTYSHVNFKAGTPKSAQSTVVAGKTANSGGVDAPTATWSWAYTPATQALPQGSDENGQTAYLYTVPPPVAAQVNITTATDPLGQVTNHYHFGLHSAPHSPQSVGIYMGSSNNAEIVLRGYQYRQISTQQDALAHLFYPGNYHPLAIFPAQEYRDRAGESFITERSGFDNWGNPSSVMETGSSSDGRIYTRHTALTWNVDTAPWRLRQIGAEVVTVGGQTHTTTRSFDGNGNVLTQTAAGVAQTFAWHASGDLQSSSNALSQTTTYTQYHRGIAQSEAQPGGVTITRTVDQAGNITAQTDGAGHTTKFTYDSLGRVTSIKPPLGNAINVSWTANSRSVQRGGMTDKSTWDGFGRLIQRQVSAQDAAPLLVNFHNDLLGRRIFQSWPNSGKGTGFRYDMLGRVVQTLHGNTPGSDSADLVEDTSHYSLLQWHADSSGRGAVTFLRAFGNPEESHAMRRVAGEMEGETLYADYDAQMMRDLLGQLTSVTMDGKTRSYSYDSHYFLTSKTEPETGTTLFGRDAIGNMTSQSRNGEIIANYGYDSRNRLASIVYPDSEDANVPKAPDITYSYDNNDNATSIISGPIQRHFAYDAAGNLVQEHLKIGNATQTASYTFNANGALQSITYPSGHKVQYQPDALGRARAALPHVSQIDYHPNGMPAEIRYANGVKASMPLNDRQWPAALKVARYANQLLVNSQYAYDAAGNLVEIDDSADMQYSRLYYYDALNRIRIEGSAQGWRDFYYDASGNITHIQQPDNSWQIYTYASSGRLDAVSGAATGNRTYAYDSAGNVTSDGTFTFGYDRANNMRCMHCTAPAPALHTYDGNNMRVQTLESGTTTQYLYNHQGLLLQTLVPGVERKEHIYLGRRQIALRRIKLD